MQNTSIADPATERKFSVLLLRSLIDGIFWITALIYALGGIWYQGKLRLTYIGDFWTTDAVSYVVLRFALGIKFRETSFGKACLELLDLLTRTVFEREWRALKFISAPASVLGLIVIYTLALFLYLPLLHYWNGGGVWDTGIIDNAVFNASRTGRFFTYLYSDGIHPLLYVPNNHLNLGLSFFALIYHWIPRTEILFIAQSVALLSAVFPLYRLGKLVLPKEIPSWFPVVLYLLWDPVYRMNLWDIHEAPFLIPFSLWAFYFIEQRRIGLAVLNMFLMAIWREDAWWTFAGMSLWLGYRTRQWRIGIPGFILGFFLFPVHASMLNHVNKISDRYPFLADNLKDSIKLIVLHPLVLPQAIVGSWRFFLELLLKSGGGVFLLGGVATVPAIPTVLEAGLSPTMSLWYNHYVGNFTAPVMVATLYGWRTLDAWFKKHVPGKDLTRVAAVSSLALCLTQIKTSLPPILAGERAASANQACLDRVSAVVPSEVPVLVADNDVSKVLTRLNHREWIMKPQSEADQTHAQWLVSNEKQDLAAGMKGANSVKHWQIVWEECGFFVANRGKE